jgi:hypothetical protein
MIPLWKEKEIRKALEENPNLIDRDAAFQFDTTKQVIRRIKKATGLRPRGVPKSKARLARPKRCPDCGARLDIWPCVGCRPWAYYYDDVSLEKKEDDATKKAA